MSQTMTEERKEPVRPHKKTRMVRLNERLAQQLEILSERNLSGIGAELNRAARLLLEQEGLWPDLPSR